MHTTFPHALQCVLAHEGGFVVHPQDPGGATNYGITLTVFKEYYGQDQSVEALRAITPAQVEHIYRVGYWERCACDALPVGVDYVVFDQAVHAGPRRSIRWLQEALGVPVDGVLGPQTRQAAQTAPAAAVITTMCDRRLHHLRSLRAWRTFGRGWERRVAEVRAEGLRLAGA